MKAHIRSFLLLFAATITNNLVNAQGGITIVSGGNLVANGAANLVINNGSITNSGTFTPSTSTVTFTGTATSATTYVGGTSATAFYNLGINKSAGTAKFLRNTAITNSIIMTAGNFDLNGFDIDLGSSASVIGESSASTFVGTSGGTLQRTVVLNAPNAVNPGNIGIEITSAANLGSTVIKRGTQQQTGGTGGYGIYRYYDIIPTNNTALNATVKMYYMDSELAGIAESELKLWSLSTAPGSIWTLLGADAQDATANYVLKNGVSQLYRLTLGSSVSHTLPIQLSSFNAQLVSGKTLLDWTTAFELNNHHFDVEKSADARNFGLLGTVTAKGNSNTPTTYSLVDANPFTGVTYYRLKQVNADGSFTYSKVVAVSKSGYSNALVNAYPNPTAGPVAINFTSSDVIKAIVQVTDARGLVVMSKEVTTLKGLNNVSINMAQLAQGTYYLRLVGIDTKAITILKN